MSIRDDFGSSRSTASALSGGTGVQNGGSSRSGSGTGSGGGNTGLTTGNTWYGNTAYGPSGGTASGYATRTGAFGMGPSLSQFSNFRTLSGAPVYGGGVQNQTVTARNATQARSIMDRLAAAFANRAAGTATARAPAVASRFVPGLLGAVAPAPITISSLPPLSPALASYRPYLGAWNGGINLMNRIIGYPDYLRPERYGAFSNSYYDNPQLGTPGLGTGLGNYSNPSNVNRTSKGDLGGLGVW